MNNTGEINAVDPIEHGHYYHIYNHGVGGRDIFCETTNYEYFLKLYDKYISPIAETCAWVLMKNHFHLLVRIQDLTGFGNLQELVTDYQIIIKINL